MRRIILLISFTIIGVCVSAQPLSVKNIIRKYDAKYLRKEKGFSSPLEFWNTIQENDKRVKAIGKAYEKDNKTLKETLMALYYVESNSNSYDFTVSDYDSIVRRLVHDLGIERLVIEKPIKVISDNYVNASMDVSGQMRINRGCFERLTYGELLAVCAHEMAHRVCAHVVSSVWNVAKKQKRNKMWADVGASLFIGAMAATSGYAGANGQDVSHFNDIIANADIIYNGAYNYANDATVRYGYRYDRDEESEADIISYRFMEQLGFGGENVISMLKKLMSFYGDTPTGKYDDHPSFTFRIQVISAMINGYSGK